MNRTETSSYHHKSLSKIGLAIVLLSASSMPVYINQFLHQLLLAAAAK